MSAPRSWPSGPIRAALAAGALVAIVGTIFLLVRRRSGATRPSSEPAATARDAAPESAAAGVVPPDREAEVARLLQVRELPIRKCYQDVLNEKHDRTFRGSVRVAIALDVTGRPRDVRAAGGTLVDKEVVACVVETLKEFEYPPLQQPGEVQYEFNFRPAD